jgi:hypothetical protein
VGAFDLKLVVAPLGPELVVGPLGLVIRTGWPVQRLALVLPWGWEAAEAVLGNALASFPEDVTQV